MKRSLNIISVVAHKAIISETFYIALLLLLTNLMSAQSIKGKVLDSTRTAVPFATVAVLNKVDSSIVTGYTTDEDGNFVINGIAPGSYLLRVTSVAFNPQYSEFIDVKDSALINIPDIVLNSQGIDLTMVSVSAIKKIIEFKDGNIIVNVENSPLAKGNTVYDLLSKLPGVTVDNDVIQLNGKSGVVIMIDGRIQQVSNAQLINMLKSMNAEIVQKIELLKNPPVKYDASGTSGMINIKTKKAKLIGISGSVYGSGSQGYCGRSMAGIAINYKSRKIALFSNLDYNYGYYQTKEKMNKKFKTDTSLTEFNSINTINDLENSLSYRVGADWFVNEKNIIGFKIDGSPGSYTSSGDGTNSILEDNDLGFDHLNSLVYTPDKWNIINYNASAEHTFDTAGTVLNFSSDYTILSETNSSDVQNLFLDANNNEVLSPNIYRSGNKGKTDIFASRLDLKKVVSSKTTIEIGAKASFVNTSNDFSFERKDNFSGLYLVDTSLTNNYTYEEQNYAVYVNYIRSFKKGSMQLGVRGEGTSLIGRNTIKFFELKRNYYNLFPNILIEYAASENNGFQLNLNRRIDRPSYSDLNPFKTYRDQYAYNEGNPFLLPHYSNTIELTHTYKESITNTFTYTRIEDVMLSYTKQDDSSKVTIQSVKNMNYNNYYAYAFYIQKSVKPWWDVSAYATVSYIEYAGDVDGAPFKTASFYYTPSLTNVFTAPKDTKIEIIGFYRSAKNIGLIQVKPRWMVSLALKKSFFKDKLDCSIGINDIFNSSFFRTEVNFDNQNWDFTAMQDNRRIVLSINYNFGKIIVDERDTNSSEDEKGRLNH